MHYTLKLKLFECSEDLSDIYMKLATATAIFHEENKRKQEAMMRALTFFNRIPEYKGVEMTKILLVDDHLSKRKSLVETLINRYEVAETDQPDRTFVMIEKFAPSIILINRLPLSFNPVSLFLNIKKHYPKMPVLLYALSGPDAFKTLKQTISMALSGKKAIPETRINQMASSLFGRTV